MRHPLFTFSGALRWNGWRAVRRACALLCLVLLLILAVAAAILFAGAAVLQVADLAGGAASVWSWLQHA